jgi:murein DD-endopeptidase MepM/ murein hydrolase activator NlpD
VNRGIYISLVIAIVLFSATSWKLPGGGNNDKTGEGTEKKDTVKAIVRYGEDKLFEKDLSETYITDMIDSLMELDTVPVALIHEINFFKDIRERSESDITTLIDSMFELDTIPYALINEINYFVALRPENYTVPRNYTFVPYDTSMYPANYFYKSWNSRYPFNYPRELSMNDSTTVLLLRDSASFCDYHHPLGDKTIFRYHGTVTSHFGWRDGKSHNGVDLELHRWDKVHAVFPGMVRMARTYSGYGKVVVIRHYNGLETLYAHLERIKVKPGQIIEAGEVVGLGGSTGQSTGTHLHLEMRFKGVPLNPSHIIDFKEKRLVSDTIVLKKTRKSYVSYPHGIKFHTVKRGDYVYRVAKRYGIAADSLCEMNGITTRTRLTVGSKLRVSK